MRLRSLTRVVSGDERPKQFCNLLDGQSLLTKTRRRVERNIAQERTLFVLLRSHECYYDRELPDVAASRMVIQPANRGTLPAVLYSLLRLDSLDPDSVVAFFPSDHHYANEEKFMTGVELAFGDAEANPNAVILLGAQPTYAATDYGWIEAAPSMSKSDSFLRVARFWEKPSHAVAADLLDRGCVWNTFVMVGRTRAFLNMIQAGAPDVYDAFRPLIGRIATDPEAENPEATVAAVYRDLESTDLSKHVLQNVPRTLGPQSLGVFCLGNVGWSDLGDPERLLNVVGHETSGHWAALWRHGVTQETGAGGELQSAGAVA
jgi:mannose-1-phosphate guanylyltransferase